MSEKDLNFRHLIKTLIPGFFTSVSLMFLFDLVIFLNFGENHKFVILNFGIKDPVLFVAALIPVSMFIGIIVNTFCFVYLFSFIKEIWKKSPKGLDFIPYKKKMISKVLAHYSQLFDISDDNEIKDFELFFDEKSFLLNRQDMSNYQHIRTGYFYYLEFQLNSIIAIFFIVSTFGFNLFCRKFVHISLFGKFCIISIVLLLSVLICNVLYKAILKNYDEYVKKELSYMLGAFHICKGKNNKE